jgi:ABC-2 type transport system ATP-binding protein
MTARALVEAINITKKYGNVMAVDNLSLIIPRGVCFGLLGPNGAGKTTLIEIMEDIISPTAGEVRFEGEPISTSFREKIGIMFQQTALLAFMTVQETLTVFQSLYQNTQPIDELIALCHLGEIRRQLNDKISGGQRQRLLLALALINQPDLLFLDEPSTGLDPQARHNLWDIIHAIKKQQKTIVLTTHYMDEAQELCDQVAIMDHGKIVVQGTSEELIHRYTQGLTISLPKGNLEHLKMDLPFATIDLDDRMALKVDNINTAIQQLLSFGVDVSHMRIQSPNLETVFLNLTGRRLRD